MINFRIIYGVNWYIYFQSKSINLLETERGHE